MQHGEPEVRDSRALVSVLRSPCFWVDSLGNLTPQSLHVALPQSRTHASCSYLGSVRKEVTTRTVLSAKRPQEGAGNLQCSRVPTKGKPSDLQLLTETQGNVVEHGTPVLGNPLPWVTREFWNPERSRGAADFPGVAGLSLLSFQHLQTPDHDPDVSWGMSGSNRGCGNSSWGTACCPGGRWCHGLAAEKATGSSYVR